MSQDKQKQRRTDRRTAIFAGIGVGAAFGVLFGLLLSSLAVALGAWLVCGVVAVLGLNAIRKDSQEIVDDVADDVSEPGA